MNLRSEGDADARFSAYVEGLASVVGHADLIEMYFFLGLPNRFEQVRSAAAWNQRSIRLLIDFDSCPSLLRRTSPKCP